MKAKFSLRDICFFVYWPFLNGFGLFSAHGECDYERIIKSQTRSSIIAFKTQFPWSIAR